MYGSRNIPLMPVLIAFLAGWLFAQVFTIQPKNFQGIKLTQTYKGNQMKTGYIYFVHADGTNRYKIGLTVDLDRRMRELNGKQAPFENKLLWSIEVSDMRSAEKDLHDMFSNRRVNGEWFVFNESELDEVGGKYDRISEKYPVP